MPCARGFGFSNIWRPPPTSRYVRTPGASVNRPKTLLRVVAERSMTSFVSTVLGVLAATSTTGASLDTVTVSPAAPTLSCTSTLAVNPTVSRISCRRTD